MQNDLISRKALIKHLVDWRLQEAPYGICDEETETYKTICGCIEAVKEQPTAYDVKKVLAVLEKEMVRAEEWVREEMGRDGNELNFEHYVGERNAYMDAMTIVRYGGKE